MLKIEALLNIAAKGSASVLSILVVYFASSSLSVQDSSLFLLSLVLVRVATLFSKFGWDQYILKEYAISISQGSTNSKIVPAAVSTVLMLSVVAMLACSIYLCFVSGASSLSSFPVIISILPFSVLWIALSVLKARGMSVVGGFFEVGVSSLIFLVSLAVVRQVSLFEFSLLYCLSVLVSCLVCILLTRENSYLPARSDVGGSEVRRDIVSIALLGFVISSSTPLLAGFFLTVVDAGAISLSARVANSVSFVVFSLNGMLAPRFAVQYSKGNLSRLRSMYWFGVLFSLSFAIPIFCVGLIWGEEILYFFSPEYAPYVEVLNYTLATQLIYSVVGSLIFLMNMTGQQVNSFRVNTVAAISSVVLQIAGAYFWGIHGLLLFCLLVVVMQGGSLFYYANKKLKLLGEKS